MEYHRGNSALPWWNSLQGDYYLADVVHTHDASGDGNSGSYGARAGGLRKGMAGGMRRSKDTKLTPVGDVIRSLFPTEDAKERVRRLMSEMAVKESAKQARESGRAALTRETGQRAQESALRSAAGHWNGEGDPFALDEERVDG